MISIQINVNSTFIAHVYIRNVSPDSTGVARYEWSYYMPGDGLVTGEFFHNPKDRLEDLLFKVISGIRREKF